MRYCKKCGTTLSKDDIVCPKCGEAVQADNKEPRDQSENFDPNDIAENKIYAVLMYLTNIVGIIIALLAAKDSEFVKFHIHQVLKLYIITIISAVITAVLSWTLIVLVVGGIWLTILTVVGIIGLVNACQGKAVKLPIITIFKFLD